MANQKLKKIKLSGSELKMNRCKNIVKRSEVEGESGKISRKKEGGKTLDEMRNERPARRERNG